MKKIILIIISLIIVPSSIIAQESNDKSICSKIEKKVDDFTGKINFSLPFSMDYHVSIKKIIDTNKVRYLLVLRTTSTAVMFNREGVILLFTDGTKWQKSDKIFFDTGEKIENQYKSYTTLNESDLALFSTKTIDKFRLYVFDQNVKKKEADNFKEYVNCMITAK